MILPTHFFFGLAVGFLFLGQPGLALLVAVGSVLPDLDREYWFMKPTKYRDEQLHRALFHNFFAIAVIFLVSPFVSLGMFLHVFLDSLTTVKDRGSEWLFPVTRLVKRGRKDADDRNEELDPREHVYFYQEDSKGMLENVGPDFREVGDKPVPWRRTYGPALNGQLLDKGFLLGSIAIILVWELTNSMHLYSVLDFVVQNWSICLIGLGSVFFLFIAGELDRNKPRRFKIPTKIRALKIPILAIAIILGIYSLLFFHVEILANLAANDWPSIIIGTITVTLVSIILVKWQIKRKKVVIV